MHLLQSQMNLMLQLYERTHLRKEYDNLGSDHERKFLRRFLQEELQRIHDVAIALKECTFQLA